MDRSFLTKGSVFEIIRSRLFFRKGENDGKANTRYR